jgi:hypothetical protein
MVTGLGELEGRISRPQKHTGEKMNATQIRPSDLIVRTVAALRDEAASAGDLSMVRDAERVVYWLNSGGAAMGVRCRAATRVARALSVKVPRSLRPA